MLTKEKYVKDLEEMEAIYYNGDTSFSAMKMFKKALEDMFELLDEHFNNPPLKFEELKPNMWVWDNRIKAWFLIKAIKPQSYWNIVIYANYLTDVFEEIRFEENRFYRKQVEE